MAQLRRSSRWAGLLGLLTVGSACIEQAPRDGNGAPSPPEGELPNVAPISGGEFVSSTDPFGGGRVEGFGALSGWEAMYVRANGSDDVPPAIPNAEVLQLSGDRLYAVSRFGGLNVVDASDPAALRRLGAYRSAGVPVDMYEAGGVVHALFDSWDAYACDADGRCGWHWTSRIQVLDARDPGNIRALADAELPGHIDGARRVGDVLYVVTDQFDGCWGCGDEYAITITSFDMADTSQLRQLDRLRLTGLGYVGKGNVAINDRRIYISQTRFDEQSQRLPSTLHVVDITDPTGALLAGARFDVGGPIEQPWQLDELDGVLRVISQPRGWGSDEPPLIETFQINSSSDVQRVGSLAVALGATYEVIDTVRFAGARAYAGSSQKRAPLHTFDLTDPADPRQASDLELPGPLYQLEPRGQQLIAFGNDARSADGSLSVSLFDVEDLTAPALLGRVAFGSDGRRPGDEPDQHHYALSVAPEAGLILVPFSASSQDEVTCQRRDQSGVQLLELGDTTLSRRGFAPLTGSARRAFLHQGRLLGVSDSASQTFDITDRDSPVLASRLYVSRTVSSVRVLGDEVLRLGSDESSRQSTFELTPLVRASDPQPTTELDLSALLAEDTAACDGTWAWSDQVFVRGDYAYLPRYVQASGPQYELSEQRLAIHVVDIADRSAPRTVGRLLVPAAVGTEYFTGVVQTDNALLVGRVRYESPSYPSELADKASAGAGSPSAGATSPGAGVSPDVPRYSYDVIELGDPAAPTIASQLEIPPWVAENGWGWLGTPRVSVETRFGWYDGRGNAELTSGDSVIGSHREPVPGEPLQAKYYLDRLDVSDPYQPRWLEPISIPGSVLAYDGSTNRLITLEYLSELEPADDATCSSRGASSHAESEGCRVSRRSINAVTIQGNRAVRTSQILLDRERLTTNIALSSSRVFYTTSDFPSRSPTGDPVPPPPGAVTTGTIRLETIEWDGDQLVSRPAIELRASNDEGYGDRLYAREDRAFELFNRRMTVVDTRDPSAPTQQAHELPEGACASFDVAGETAYCAAGQRGVEVIDLRATP